MYYGDKKRAMVNIMKVLIEKGWKVFGYTPDKSDSMQDIYSPSHWDGIATKNGYVLVIDQYSTSYSGYEVKKYDYSKMNKAHNANEKVIKLTAKMLDHASTPNEKAACAILIEKESEKGNAKPTYEVLETYPTFAHSNPKGCSFHIEKDGQIITKGTGIFSCYVGNDHIEANKIERDTKISAMVKRFETAIKQDSALESEVIKIPVTVIKPVETEQANITEAEINDNTTFIMKVGYTNGINKGTLYQLTRIYTGTNTTYIFSKLGKKLQQLSGSGKEWYITFEKFITMLTKGHIALVELKEFTEYVDKIVYNKTAKKVKQDLTVTALTGEVEEVVKFSEELELNAESILDIATTLMTNSNDDLVKPITAEEKEAFKNKLCEMIVDYKLFVNEEVIKYFKVNGYKLMFELLESYTTQQAPEATQQVEEVETTNTITEEQKPMINTMDVLKAYNAKIKSLDYNKQDVLNQFDFLVDNKDKFYNDFMDFLNTDVRYKKKRKATKEEIAKDQYKVELSNLGYADRDIYTSESYMIDFSRQTPQTEDGIIQRKIDNMKKVIDKITDESILLHIASKQAYRAEMTKAVKEPETVTEYETKLRITGSLTEDEQVKYEALKALKQVEANEQKKVKTIEAIESAEFTITESKHTKTGEQIFIVNMKERVDKDKFNEINIKMKSLGAYYSSFPSNRGFIFKSDPTELLNTLQSGEDVEVKKERDLQAQAEKLEQLADNMQDTIDDKKADRKTNTAKREREAAGQYEQAEAMEFTQSILKNVSNALSEGSLLFLKGVNAKTHIETLESILRGLKYNNDRINNLGYEESRKRTLTESDILTLQYPRAMANKTHLQYILKVTANKKGYIQDSNKIGKLVSKLSKEDYSLDVTRYKEEILSLAYGAMQSEKYSSEAIKECFNHINRLQVMGINTVEHLRAAMREYLTLRPTRNREETKEQKIKKLESVARFHSNIGGYFPTPKTIVEQLLDLADITEGETVLEPSAGNGNILDGISEYLNDNSVTANVEGIEYNNSLRNILELKNYKIVADDFLQYSKFNHYNKIIMNPPFEKNQDIDHVLHAYKMLNNNGRIVAIMSPHFTFANDSKSVSFREWLSGVGHYENLPEGSFRESGTGVNTVIVVIDKIEQQQAQQAV